MAGVPGGSTGRTFRRALIVVLTATAALMGAQTALAGKTPAFAAGSPYDTGSFPNSVAISDFNRDGVPDVATADFLSNHGGAGPGQISVLLGNADGTLQAKADYDGPLGSFNARSIAAGDFDNDGDPDLAVSYGSVQDDVAIFLGSGDGTFGAATGQVLRDDGLGGPAAVVTALKVRDMNGDGKLDLVGVDSTHTAVVALGNGDGTFAAASTSATANIPKALAVADFDGDGKLDVATANFSGSVSVLLGDGAGGLGTHTDYPAGSIPSGIAAGDLNGDGKLDLAVSNDVPSDSANSVNVLLGQGDGTFADSVSYPAGDNARGIALGDINVDGKLDVAVTNNGVNTVAVLLGSGDGTLQPAQSLSADEGPLGIAIADFNRDGAPDLLDANTGAHSVSVFLQTTSYTLPATFQPHADAAIGDNPRSVIARDLNGDGHPDLVTSNINTNTVSVMLGDGDGTVQPKTEYPVGFFPTSVAVGDLNGDGKLDLVSSNFTGSTVSFLAGAGDGAFDTAVPSVTSPNPGAVAIGDFNADGKLDLALQVAGNQVSIMPGDGSGEFPTHQEYATDTGPQKIALGDLNRDGKLDLVSANSTASDVSVLLGNGDGTLQAKADKVVGSTPNAVAIGDLNRDGKPDLVTTNASSVSVLLGHGDGEFDTHADSTQTGQPLSLAIGDINGDGRLDVATANFSGDTASVLLGNGDGTLQAAVGHTTGTGSRPNAVTLADFNGDGEPDLATSNGVSDKSSILIQHGDLDHFVVEANGGGAISDQQAGSPFSIQIDAVDVNGTTDSDFTGQIDYTGPAGCTAGCTTSSAFTAGVLAAHSITLTAAGSTAVSVGLHNGVPNVSPGGTSNTFTVSPAALDHSAIVGGDNQTPTVGGGFAENLVVKAEDAYGNGVPNTLITYSAPGTGASVSSDISACDGFTDSDGNLLCPAPSANTVAGTYQIGTTTAGLSTSPSFSVTNEPDALDHFAITENNNPVADHTAGDLFFVKFAAQDQYGNLETDFNGTGEITGSLANSCLDCGSASFSSGILNRQLGFQLIGHEHIHIVQQGGAISSDSNDFDISPAAASKLVWSPRSNLTSGSQADLTGQVQDAYGNQTQDNGRTFTITNSGTSCSGTLQLSSDHPQDVNGVVTVHVTGKKAGDVCLHGASSGLTTGDLTFTVVPGASTQLDFDNPPSTCVTHCTVHIAVLDANGNLTDSSYDTTVRGVSGGVGAIVNGPAVAAVHGIATVPITVSSGGALALRATASSGLGPLTPATSSSILLIKQPTITSFSPTSAKAGVQITLTGQNFTGVTAVKFGSVSGMHVMVDSNILIRVTVPATASTGKITVTNPAGSFTSAASFTVIKQPTISSFTPLMGPVGTVVTIKGTNFPGTTAVKFNGILAPVQSVISGETIRATVPANATTGKISVVNAAGAATSAGLFKVLPKINSFSPASALPGEKVTITGSAFTGATAVKLNGVTSTFTVTSGTQIKATVPATATTGKISVTTPGGTAISTAVFKVLPKINSFTPTSGAVGAKVTITGLGFTGATAVTFSGKASAFTVVSATSIKATVPAGATTGKISVTTAGGTSTSAANFTVLR